MGRRVGGDAQLHVRMLGMPLIIKRSKQAGRPGSYSSILPERLLGQHFRKVPEINYTYFHDLESLVWFEHE